MGWASTVYYRAWQDVFMGSRLAEYSVLLMRLKELGYRFCTMTEFAAAADRDEHLTSPACLLRNDVDSDPRGAARMFDCDRSAGLRATYYFRLATLDPALAARITAYGSEVGYHFEEIATVAKRLGWRTKDEVATHLELVRDEFRKNLAMFRKASGVPVRTVASHGDFANRQLGVPNRQLLTQSLLDELGVLDVYDRRIHGNWVARFTDRPPPQWWRPDDPMRALEKIPTTVSILVHPRQWICNPSVNIGLTVGRVGEAAAWRMRSALRAKQVQRAPQSAVR